MSKCELLALQLSVIIYLLHIFNVAVETGLDFVIIAITNYILYTLLCTVIQLVEIYLFVLLFIYKCLVVIL